MCTPATKLVHLLPVGPILPSAVRIQELNKKIILKPYNIQTPKEQVYFHFWEAAAGGVIKMQVQGVKETYSFILTQFPRLLKNKKQPQTTIMKPE